MTRTLIRSDLDEIDDFIAEYGGSDPDTGTGDPRPGETSIDTLIAQLEASSATADALIRPLTEPGEDLRGEVRALADQLERIATDLARINQKLQ